MAELWHEKGITEENDDKISKDDSKLNITFIHQFIINHLALTTVPFVGAGFVFCSNYLKRK